MFTSPIVARIYRGNHYRHPKFHFNFALYSQTPDVHSLFMTRVPWNFHRCPVNHRITREAARNTRSKKEVVLAENRDVRGGFRGPEEQSSDLVANKPAVRAHLEGMDLANWPWGPRSSGISHVAGPVASVGNKSGSRELPCPWQDITRQNQQEKRSPMALEGRPTDQRQSWRVKFSAPPGIKEISSLRLPFEKMPTNFDRPQEPHKGDLFHC